MLEYGRPMNENDMIDRQRYRKVQGGVKMLRRRVDRKLSVPGAVDMEVLAKVKVE